MPVELYRDDRHVCLAFEDLVRGNGIQSNQFLVLHDHHAALIDPGGALTYTPLSMAIGRLIDVKKLDYVIASHQDPDIIASLDKWLLYTNCKVVSSELWSRFLPHLVPGYMEWKGADRFVGIPDRGGNIVLGDAEIKALPAHFLHSVGNFVFYDPISRILFSGDIGASTSGVCTAPVEDFERHLPGMEAFHKRYMNSNKVCRLFANMVRRLEVDMIVPQHGCAFQGPDTIGRFLDWLENLQCGTDLIAQEDYRAV